LRTAPISTSGVDEPDGADHRIVASQHAGEAQLVQVASPDRDIRPRFDLVGISRDRGDLMTASRQLRHDARSAATRGANNRNFHVISPSTAHYPARTSATN
jgi:hypothetical protein